MRIGFVTTYPPTQCGIGTYSENLVKALAARPDVDSVHVVGDRGAGPSGRPGIHVLPTWPIAGAFEDTVFEALTRAHVDVAHVQHAPDLMPLDDQLPRLVERLAGAGIPTVVTLHTVYDRPGVIERESALAAPAFHRGVAAHGAVLVHHESIRPALTAHGVPPERVAVVPHGTTVLPPADPQEARRHLDLPQDATIFLHFGFIHAQKNLHTAVLGFLLAAPFVPTARLVVSGMPRAGHWYNKVYIRALQAASLPAGLLKRIIWRIGFAPQEDVPRWFAAADVVLLPHAYQPYGSASGVFHHAMGTGRAVIASREPKFRELREIEGLPPECGVNASDPRDWARAIRTFARDPDLRRRAAASLARHAEATSWANVAARHVAVYERLREGGPAAVAG